MALKETIVLFDGVCNLCNGTVRFVSRRDPAGKLSYASLQSDYGQGALERFNRPKDELDTFILLEGDRVTTRSTAALRLTRYLRFPWPLLSVFLAVPRPLRDAVYKWIARNRYAWFGRVEVCPLPTSELESRFLS